MQLQQKLQQQTPWWDEIDQLNWHIYDLVSSGMTRYNETRNANDYPEELINQWQVVSNLLADAINYSGTCECRDLPDGRGYTCPTCDILAQVRGIAEEVGYAPE